MPKVSVIVPVYRVEEYIERCVRSLFEQTLDDMEILFINDCTPDNSIVLVKNVLEEYPARKAQTRIISMPSNEGVASARRRGILEAKGEYIIHCDSDDWVDHDLYEKMYAKTLETGADVVMCGEIHDYPDKKIFHDCGPLPYSGKKFIREWYSTTPAMFFHDKLVKRSLYINHDILPWAELDMWDDNGVMARILYYSQKISAIEGSYYHYNRCNAKAMTNGYGEKQVRQMIAVASLLTDFFKAQPDFKDFEKTALAFQYLAKLNLLTDSYKRLREYRRIFPESTKIIRHIPLSAFSKKGRIRFLMVKYHLAWLFVTLFKTKTLLIR